MILIELGFFSPLSGLIVMADYRYVRVGENIKDFLCGSVGQLDGHLKVLPRGPFRGVGPKGGMAGAVPGLSREDGAAAVPKQTP